MLRRCCWKTRIALIEQADVLFAIGRYLALADDLNKAKDYIRRAIKLNGMYRSEFLEDDAFDAVWDSF